MIERREKVKEKNLKWLSDSKIKSGKEFLLILEFTVARGTFVEGVVNLLHPKGEAFHDNYIVGNYQFKIKLKYVEVLAKTGFSHREIGEYSALFNLYDDATDGTISTRDFQFAIKKVLPWVT